jgi:hypothetical protein
LPPSVAVASRSALLRLSGSDGARVANGPGWRTAAAESVEGARVSLATNKADREQDRDPGGTEPLVRPASVTGAVARAQH